jgi:hypothetical protein
MASAAAARVIALYTKLQNELGQVIKLKVLVTRRVAHLAWGKTMGDNRPSRPKVTVSVSRSSGWDTFNCEIAIAAA